MYFLIPLANTPQIFEISLAGKAYIMTSKWNDADEGGWVLDFNDAITNEPIIANMPLITGVNLLDGLDYLGFEGQLIVYTDGDATAVPTLLNLGLGSNLYFQADVANG